MSLEPFGNSLEDYRKRNNGLELLKHEGLEESDDFDRMLSEYCSALNRDYGGYRAEKARKDILGEN